MKKLIVNFLNANYFLSKDKINKKCEGLDYLSPTAAISTIFGLTEKQVKWYLKSWIKSINKGFNFNTYWKRKEFLDNGFIFVPYILTTTTPQINGLEFTPSSAISSRYATTRINGRYFNRINLVD